MTTHHFTIETTDFNNDTIEIKDENKVYFERRFSHGVSAIMKIFWENCGILEDSISSLLKRQDDEPILFYPFSLNGSMDLRNSNYHILEIKHSRGDQYSLGTKFLMGFISATFLHNNEDYHFNIYIHSRFDWPGKTTICYDGTDDNCVSNDNDREKGLGKDFFLHYMLQNVLNINVVRNPSFGKSESNLELLLYFFPETLRRAMKQGIYRRSERREFNDARVRGPIDISRHIAKNIPFCGKIAYSTTEFDYDNSITQLVRHTIEYIAHHEWASDLLRQSDETWGDVRLIRELTADGYDPNARQRIIQNNLRLISHPFYTEWRPLQHLCLAILRYDDLRHDRANDEDRIHGLLFDGPWLWEKYLGKVFENGQLGIKPWDNRKRGEGIPLFEGGKSLKVPDFRKPGENGWASEIWDAKFVKSYDVPVDKNNRESSNSQYDVSDDENNSNGINKNINQIVTYIHIQNNSKAGVVFPVTQGVSFCKHLGKVTCGGDVYEWGLKVENSNNYTKYDKYITKMKDNEDRFIDEYNSVVLDQSP